MAPLAGLTRSTSVFSAAALCTWNVCQPGAARCQLLPHPPLDTEMTSAGAAPPLHAVTPAVVASAAAKAAAIQARSAARRTLGIHQVRIQVAPGTARISAPAAAGAVRVLPSPNVHRPVTGEGRPRTAPAAAGALILAVPGST